MNKAEHRRLLMHLIGQLDDEAFEYLALAMLPHAMTHGAHAQIWPDGKGGFRDNADISATQQEAAAYLGLQSEM
jgi:hypothetical protein